MRGISDRSNYYQYDESREISRVSRWQFGMKPVDEIPQSGMLLELR